jgi:hypothetical protein
MTITPSIIVVFSSHPKCSSAQVNIVEDTDPTDSGLAIPHVMNETMRTAVIPKTTLSRPNLLRCSSTLMPGTSPGCKSSG